MKRSQIIRVWKDPEYRDKLNLEISMLPEHPAGWVNLTESELNEIVGGMEGQYEQAGSDYLLSFGCCDTLGFTYNNLCPTVGILTHGCCR